MELHWLTDPLKYNYANFEGRVTRQAYWMFTLWTVLIIWGLDIIGAFLDVEFLGDVFALAVFIPSIAIGARRLHDIGQTGWMQGLYLIPIVGWIILLYFLVKQGDTGANAYGNDPRAVTTPIPTPAEPVA